MAILTSKIYQVTLCWHKEEYLLANQNQLILCYWIIYYLILTFTQISVNILSMNNLFFTQKTPPEIAKNLAEKIQVQRKKMKISQEKLAEKSGVSLGSIKRFETKYEISLVSFIKILVALGLDSELDNLFVKKEYNSIEEVING